MSFWNAGFLIFFVAKAQRHYFFDKISTPFVISIPKPRERNLCEKLDKDWISVAELLAEISRTSK